jgi:trk system potassium uptake protein TrkH
MNYKKLGNILGKIMILEGALMLAPLIVSFIYREDVIHKLSFAITIAILAGCGFLLQIPKPKRNNLYQKEGFALTALVWVIMAAFGAIPFVINGDIPHYVDALFEIMSGFTTTGSSILTDVTTLAHSSLFWRSFSHWIGGMGVLVFVLIFIPESNDGSSMHLLRAESPGPQVGKLVSKMKVTTRILYLIYLGMTVLVAILLMLDKPIPGYEEDHLFISILTACGCAGTGGFGLIPGSLELYHPFSQYVVAFSLIFFGVNFSLYYMILIGQVKNALKSEELRVYLIMVASAVGLIFFSLVSGIWEIPQTYTTEEAFRHSLFQVATLVSTAGFSTTDFNVWPMMAQMVLLIMMFTGGMAGSTAGGTKLSRSVIAFKGAYINVRKLINPRYVPKAKFEGKTLESNVINDVFAYFTLYLFIVLITLIVLSFDPVNGTITTIVSDAGTYTVQHGFYSNFTAIIACLCNIGPGFEAVSAYAGFANYSVLSKVVLTFAMMAGRLEILPVLILFSRRTWTKI